MQLVAEFGLSILKESLILFRFKLTWRDDSPLISCSNTCNFRLFNIPSTNFFLVAMQNLEFWLTDAGVPYDVDASYNSIIVNANKLTPSHVTSFESLAVKLFAAACNDHPGMK